MSFLGFFNKKDNGFTKVISGLSNKADKIRFNAIEELEKMKLTKNQRIDLIRMATSTYPSAKYEWQTIPSILIETATKEASEEYIKEIEDVFADLDSSGKKSALWFLQRYEKEEAISTYIKLITQNYEELDSIPAVHLERTPKYEHIIFPQILRCISNEKVAYDIYLLTLNYLNKDLIDISNESRFLESIIVESQKNRQRIQKIENENKNIKNWIWDNDEYLEIRYKQGIILDLLGYVSGKAAEDELIELLKFTDNKLKYFAVISLLRHSKSVDNMVFEKIAEDPETRNWLYDKLKSMNMDHLYPAKFRTQEAFAESDMINWLLYPTELGRVPDEIELMKVVEEETNTADGVLMFYLFRFRSNHPDWIENGWTAGMAGPYLKKESPTTGAHGYTFSAFEKWEDKTMEEHVDEIIEIIGDWRENSSN
jgi:hypothetical protein